MATTTRGYPIFTGGMAPAGPTQMQQLAESIDADVTATTADTGWINATLTSGWVNFGGAYRTAQYRRKAGIVYLRGEIKSGTTFGTVLTLPVGFRPAAFDTYTVTGNTSANSLEIGPSGAVVAGAAGLTAARQSLTLQFPVEA